MKKYWPIIKSLILYVLLTGATIVMASRCSG